MSAITEGAFPGFREVFDYLLMSSGEGALESTQSGDLYDHFISTRILTFHNV